MTSPPRTLLDLSTLLPSDALSRAVEQAEKELLDFTGLHDLVGLPGATKLLNALGRTTATNSRSDFERAFLGFLKRHRLPRPADNVIVEGLEVDFYWPAFGVVVEADSFEHHGTRQAFERDRARDAILAAAGYRTGRYTTRQLRQRPDEVLRALSGLGVQWAGSAAPQIPGPLRCS